MSTNAEQYISNNASIGSVPSTVSGTNVAQVMELGGYDGFTGVSQEHAYLSSTGTVHAFTDLGNFSFDMGEPISDKSVIEFTARPYRASYIFTVKNAAGVARDVYCHGSGVTYGEPKHNVIKVAAGKMLVQEVKNNVPTYAIDVKNKVFLPVGANNQLDMYVGVGNVTDVFLDNKITDTMKIIDGYTLKTSHELFKNGVKVDSNVRDIGMLGNTDTIRMTLTSSQYATYLGNLFSNTLSSPPYSYQASFIDTFMSYFKSHLISCQWIGVAQSGVGSTGVEKPCISNMIRGVGTALYQAFCRIYNNPKGGVILGSNMEYFKTIDANAFNAMYSNNGTKIQLFGSYIQDGANQMGQIAVSNFIDMDITVGKMSIMT